MERRNFLKNTLSFSLLMALHKTAQSYNQFAKANKMVNPIKVRFPEITLYTSKLEEQFDFYAKVLEFQILHRDKTQFSINIGGSTLKFKVAKEGTDPLYHYAINIPSNKYQKAKKWLSEKTPLLLDADTGEDLQYFDFWDAHAMYFKDPSGNIGELIARHTLNNDREGEFGISDLLCISEIGTPVENPYDLASELKTAYGLDTYGSAMFIGDENGLFVAAPIDRLWFPENIEKASVYPTEIYIANSGKDQFKFENYPYKIKRKN